jgi:signal transduction histidine kinase
MKLKGRLGASLTLVIALAATIGLFTYALQFKKDSVRTLQVKLQDMELQRLDEEKSQQTAAAAQQAAERFNQYAAQVQKRLEAVADSSSLRQPQDKPALRKAKAEAGLRLLSGDATWSEAVLTDQAGEVIMATPAGSGPLGATAEFREVSRQRMTALRLLERKGRDLALQITVPCLGNTGGFLGVLQAETTLSQPVLDKILNRSGLINLLGTSSGRRLTPVPLADFPNNLGPLLDKDSRQLETYLSQPGPVSFKTDWANTHYLIGTAETRIPGVRVFTLLEVGSLEKLFGGEPLPESFLADPVILGGLLLILILGLLLMLILGGGEDGGLRKLNQELEAQIQNGEAARGPLTGPGGKAWQKLTDQINRLLERPAGSKPAAAGAGGADTLALSRLQDEFAELRQARDQIAQQNQDLLDKLEALSLQNQQLRDTLPAAPAHPPQAESSQLRIDAIVNMSEDLKATLSVIKNYISSILSSEEGKITDAQQEFLGVVINKSARLERQINDLLDLSHLESEAEQMFMVPTDMSAMVQDVILNSQPQADTKQIRLLQVLPPTLSKIMVNGDRLGQVLINLVQHALRVTPVGGEVRIEVSENDRNQVIKIRDGGVSLTPEQAAVMFSHFHGLDSQAGTALAGSGLRFAIVREIVAAHHGLVEVHGLPEGNEIILYLPLTAEHAAPAEALAPDFTPAPGPAEPAAGKREPLSESFFDLSTFMQDLPDQPPRSAPAGSEELDELLKNIEDVNEPKS